jgi:hypothetical protein
MREISHKTIFLKKITSNLAISPIIEGDTVQFDQIYVSNRIICRMLEH